MIYGEAFLSSNFAGESGIIRSMTHTKELSNLNYCETTITLKATIENSFLELAKRLKRIRDLQLYKPQWDAFADYCEEMRLSEGTASKLINIYFKFVVLAECAPEKIHQAGGWSNLAETLRLCTNTEKTKECLEMASTLSRPDLKKWVKEQLTGKDMSVCSHDDTYTITICRECAERWREHEEN